MKKVFGLTLMVAVVISLIGCGQNKAATTTETTTTEVVTEASTTEVPTTKATVSDASSTDATVPEASTNDAERLSSSSEITENVVMTENVDDIKFFSDKGEDENKRMILGYYGDNPFEIFIAKDDEENIDVTLNEYSDSEYMLFYFSGDVESTSLSDEDSTTGFKMIHDGIAEFSVIYKDGKTVNITVHVPES